jgi:DnaJ-like protein
MAQSGGIMNLAHAYRILDVPWDASPHAIKRNYRKIVKRWHPDRHRPATPEHAQSTRMTQLLNEAYLHIEHAPLRTGHGTPFSSGAPRATGESASNAQAVAGPDASGYSRSEYVPRPLDDAQAYYRIIEQAREAGAREDAARPFDWIGFAVRFAIGALFGVLVSFRVVIALWLHPSAFPVAVGATILFCALASGFGGDAFWRALRPGGMWWWRRWD